ncbi:MAG: aminoglycoside phosphotransferase family protein, partial [Halomonadaceae bacterium]
LSHHVEQGDELGSMVIEHLPGRTLESLLLNGQWKSARQLAHTLQRTLRKIWKTSRTNEPAQPEYMQQLRKRMPETRHTHPTLFHTHQTICGLPRPSFDELINRVEPLERQLRAPFSVLIHGDFNVDNLIYDELKNRIYFIDLHRASYSDYVQDLSVLMASIYRLPIMDDGPRAELMALIRQLYQFARRFAKENNDVSFDARLAIALGRSFATSTRFIYDKLFANRLALRASYLLEAITLLTPEKIEKYRLPLEDIFSD